MKTKLYLILLFCLFTHVVQANWQRSVANYTRHEYKAANQNWMVEQHPNGWMYFANNKGILEFDGVEWNTYTIHNAKTRAVRMGNDGRMYVGGLGQFGYFVPNPLGGLDYTCLSDSIDKRIVGNIWNIHVTDDRVYFQSDRLVFYLEQNILKQVKYNGEIMCSGIIYNKFYIAADEGLSILSGDRFLPVPFTRQATRSKVVGLLPYEGKVLIVSSRHGLYTYDGKELTYYTTAADSFLSSNQLFCSAMKDSLLALGSVQDGVLLLNTQYNTVEKVSIDNGLQNKTVLSLAFDRSRNLWLGLDNGIDCIHLDSPLYFLFSRKSAIGSGYAACYFRNKLYLGTNQGLYVSDGELAPDRDLTVSRVPGTEGQVWSLAEHDNTLFCGGGNSLMAIDASGSVYPLEGVRGIWGIHAFHTRNDVLLGGSYHGLYILIKENGRWKVSHRIEGAGYSSKTMYVEEMSDAIWVANKESGLFRLTLSDDLKKVAQIKCMNSDNLPAGDNVYVSKINNEIVVSSRQGLFRYNQTKDCLEEHTQLEQQLDGKAPYTYLIQDTQSNIWYVTDGRMKLLRYDAQNKVFFKNAGESYLKDFLIEDFEHIFVYDNRQAVIGTEEGFCLLQYWRRGLSKMPLNLQVRKVYLTGKKDVLVYGRSFTYDTEPLQVSYSDNSLRLQCSVNNFDKQAPAMYSFCLSGDGEAVWSEYGMSNMKEYTDLKEGKYTFRVRALTDKYKEPVETSFQFEILPPWYRTWWAYSIYALLIGSCLYLLYFRISRHQKQLIRQKNQELVKQKQEFKKESELKDQEINTLREENLQSELRHKSEELIQSTLNIVRKNEILEVIKKEAVGINNAIKEENMVAIRRKTLRLISQIDTNIEHDDDLKAFQGTFDSIHHDFFRRLDEQFPELTSKEKMLCAYIKMNLMSKEIAPLVNLSLRGVEISRYRLRKKLRLEEKDNLTEFLQHFN